MVDFSNPEWDGVEAYLKAVKKNDWSDLIALVRNNPEALTPEIRELIALKLEGKFKPTRGRKIDPEAKTLEMRQAIEIGQCHLWLTCIDGEKPYVAIETLAKTFSVSKTTVRNRIDDYTAIASGSAAGIKTIGIPSLRLLSLCAEAIHGKVTPENVEKIKALDEKNRAEYMPEALRN